MFLRAAHPASVSAAAATERRRFMLFLDWLRFQFDFAVDDVHAEPDGVDMVSLAYEIALLSNHGRELLEGDAGQPAEFHVLLLDLAVQLSDLVAVRARRHLHYIRIGLGRRYGRP